MLEARHSTLLLVDFQDKLAPVIDQAEETLVQAERLAKAAKLLNVPIIATEQNPHGLGHIAPILASFPDIAILKMSFDAARDPDLLRTLPQERPEIMIAGWEAHVCVLQTALGLLREGFKPVVVVDAIGARRADSKAIALQRLAAHGVEIVTTEMVLFEWLGTADHPAFRAVLKLIK